MCEILKDNFEENFVLIENAIRKADFIAIDTEFTGLQSQSGEKPSLFDNGEQRYTKLRQSVQKFAVVQIGLSAFQRIDASYPKYSACTFNIPVYPAAFGPVDSQLTCQVSSLDFLCQYKFDFNKLFYNGVPYLRPDQEKLIRKYINAKNLPMGRDWDERSVQQYSSRVSLWLVSAADGDHMTFDCRTVEADLAPQTLINEIRKRFTNVWIDQQGDKIVVYKIPIEKRVEYLKKAKDEEERFVSKLVGFGRVFQCLVEAKKPIVGHNGFVDMLFLIEKFHSPLPEKFSHFLTLLHELLPHLYDTKHVAFNIKRSLEDNALFESTGLGELYKSLNGEKAFSVKLFSPQISHADGYEKYYNIHIPHEAGYDAFMCGNVFIRLAHILASQNLSSSELRAFTFGEYISKMEPYKNQLNIIRAGITYVNVGGENGNNANRPKWLYVKGRFGKSLEASKLAQSFSPYGSTDVRLISSNQALVAVAAHRTAREILSTFKTNKDIRVCEYNRWKHSPVIRKFLWAGVLVSGGICIWTIYSGFQNKNQ